MKKIILFVLFAIALFPCTNFGCTCAPPPTFCDGIIGPNGEIRPNVILRGKLVRPSSGFEIEVSESLHGEVSQSRIKLGFTQCTAFANELEAGEEYIFALAENNGNFVPIGCTIFFLKIENEVVKGKIAPGVESIKYKNLSDCNMAFQGNDLKNTASIFPNPTGGDIYIKNLNSEISLANVQVEIFDILGRKVADYSKMEAVLPEDVWNIDVEKLAPGVYFFKLSGNNREGVFKIVKQ